MTIKPVDNVYFGTRLPPKQHERIMEIKKRKMFLCSQTAGFDIYQFVAEAESFADAKQLCKDYDGSMAAQGRTSEVIRELTEKEIESKTKDGAYEIDNEN